MSSSTKWHSGVRRLPIALFVGLLLGALSGGLYSAATGVRYISTASVLLSVDNASTPTELSSGLTYITDSMKTYSVLATSETAITPAVAAQAGVAQDDLRQNLTVGGQANTAILDFTYADKDKAVARRAAQAAADGFVKAMSQTRSASGTRTPLVDAAVIVPAPVGTAASLSSAPARILVGALLGGVVALVMAALSLPGLRPFRGHTPRRQAD